MSTASSIYIFTDLCLIDKNVLKGNIKTKFHLNSLKIEPMKNSFEFWLAKKIARTMLFIKATTFKKLSEEPYTWACGMLMRIYNDNRMMLGYKHRMRITLGFSNLIKKKEINPDYIIGTMTSGIAPASSLAQYLGKELLINNEGYYYIYQKDLCEGIDFRALESEQPDIVIATSPFAIPYGVQFANKLGISFAYIRSQKKDHGKKMQIEGIIKPGMKYIFLFSNESLEEIFELNHMLEKEFKLKFCSTYDVRYGHEKIVPYYLLNKRSVVIEDLFSTGGSSSFEVYRAREEGMTCNYCFSIFSYGFDCLKKQFSGENLIGDKGVKLSEPCEIGSLLSFHTLIEEIERLKFYKPDVIKEMRNEIEGFDEKYQKFLNKKL